ncbi:orotidine-5'-phosphate decarboxylase [bacterium]|nr:orotidine-5'-phosphate decarboxylase [bacterium]
MTAKKELNSLKSPVIIALDVDNPKQAEMLVEELKDYVSVFKVGSQLFTSQGPDIIDFIHNKGCKVFLDLKFHDIPNTVALAVGNAVKMGVFMLTMHASGGIEMMRSAYEAAHSQTILLGVTVLTSIDEEILKNDLQIEISTKEHVSHLAKMAKIAGLNGVVASSEEIKYIRQICGEDFLIVTPGIRFQDSDKDDQKRTASPAQAINEGADLIVVGRSITKASNHEHAMEKVIKELNERSTETKTRKN